MREKTITSNLPTPKVHALQLQGKLEHEYKSGGTLSVTAYKRSENTLVLEPRMGACVSSKKKKTTTRTTRTSIEILTETAIAWFQAVYYEHAQRTHLWKLVKARWSSPRTKHKGCKYRTENTNPNAPPKCYKLPWSCNRSMWCLSRLYYCVLSKRKVRSAESHMHTLCPDRWVSSDTHLVVKWRNQVTAKGHQTLAHSAKVPWPSDSGTDGGIRATIARVERNGNNFAQCVTLRNLWEETLAYALGQCPLGSSTLVRCRLFSADL